MALSVGTGGGPVWIGNYAGGQGGMDTPPVSILGRPVFFTEKLPSLGTTGDICFVDRLLPYRGPDDYAGHEQRALPVRE